MIEFFVVIVMKLRSVLKKKCGGSDERTELDIIENAKTRSVMQLSICLYTEGHSEVLIWNIVTVSG